MTRKLQFLLTALLLSVGVTSAWADNTVKYSTDGGSNWTEAADLNALSSVFSGATSDIQVQLLDDQTLTGRVTWSKAYTLTITATKAVSIERGSLARTAMWFLNNGTGTLTLGSSDYAITFAGAGHVDGERIFKNILGNESTGRMNIENVTFQNFKFDTENSNLGYLFLNKNYNGKLVLKNVTVYNCVTTEDAFIKSVYTNNDAIYLQGAINFNSCTADNGAYMSIMGRIRLGEIDGSSSTTITTSNPISIYWAGSTKSIGTNIIVKAKKTMLSSFNLTNETLGLFGNDTDLKLTQAYTLSVSDAGAATLVLPFESTIPTTPSGLTCYKLTYTSGDDIVATAEESTLGANKPVLVMGTASTSYKFVSTATSGDAATGSGQTSAYGNMYGNYDASWTVPVQTDSKDNYILQNKASGLGFYKVVEGQNTLSPNRAYMSVKHNDGGSSPAPAFFSLDFNGMNGTTGISITSREETTRNNDGAVYNLNGVRMNGENLPKGIYVKNGRKFVVK